MWPISVSACRLARHGGRDIRLPTRASLPKPQSSNSQNKMDFAPYQDQSPETNRTLSPPPIEGRRSFSPGKRRTYSPALPSPPVNASRISANPWASTDETFTRGFGGGGFGGDNNADVVEIGRAGLNEFETSLPIRLDYEACLAYLLLPPAGGVLLLIMERKSDYVR
jgi:hypothetical protein